MAERRRGRNEGSIYKQGDVWRGVVDLGWQGGKRRRKYLSGRTRAEVAGKVRATLAQADLGQVITGRAPTVEAWLETWLESTAQRVAPSTLTSYRNVARYYVVPALGRKRLDKVTASDIQEMTNSMLKAGLSLRSAQYAHKVAGMALKAAVRQGRIQSNPAEKVDAPTPRRKPMETVSAAEARKLLDAALGEPHGPLWVLALTSGLRQGELLALRWRDIDLGHRVLHVRQGKTAKARRSVPMTHVAIEVLGDAGPTDALVFPSANGTPLDPRNVLRAWHAFSERVLGRRTTFHGLRHSAATLMVSQGVPLKVVSEMLGHSSITITSDVYVEVVDALKADAACRMDAVFA